MKTIIMILILVSMSYGEGRVLISDSEVSSPLHYMHFIGEFSEHLRCEHIDNNFDGIPDRTKVSLDIQRASTPNLAFKSRHVPGLSTNRVDHSLCATIEKIAATNPGHLVFSFKLYLSENKIEEELKVLLPDGPVLTSTAMIELFR